MECFPRNYWDICQTKSVSCLSWGEGYSNIGKIYRTSLWQVLNYRVCWYHKKVAVHAQIHSIWFFTTDFCSSETTHFSGSLPSEYHMGPGPWAGTCVFMSKNLGLENQCWRKLGHSLDWIKCHFRCLLRIMQMCMQNELWFKVLLQKVKSAVHFNL